MIMNFLLQNDFDQHHDAEMSQLLSASLKADDSPSRYTYSVQQIAARVMAPANHSQLCVTPRAVHQAATSSPGHHELLHVHAPMHCRPEVGDPSIARNFSQNVQEFPDLEGKHAQTCAPCAERAPGD